MEEVKIDFKVLNMNRWKQKTNNRNKWTFIKNRAKILRGSQVQGVTILLFTILIMCVPLYWKGEDTISVCSFYYIRKTKG
jgi:hypothetical protein